MKYVLETNGLYKRYRDFTALNGLNLRIPKGSIYGFVGRNGAGKTTLIRLICGLQEPTGGSFTLYGAKNTDAKIERAGRRMGAVVEPPSIYLDMTAEEISVSSIWYWGCPLRTVSQNCCIWWGWTVRGKRKRKTSPLVCASGWGSL